MKWCIRMAACSKCGFTLPEGAVYCPNCGTPVKGVEKKDLSADSIAGPIRLGLIGTLLSVTILMMSSPLMVDLYFIPSFLSTIAVTYFSRTKRLKDAVIIAMTTYLFTEAINAGLVLGMLYVEQQKLSSLYGDYIPSLIDVLMYSISPITAIIAGYIGFKLAPEKREELYAYTREGGFGPTLLYRLRGDLKKFKYVLFGSYRVE